MENKKDIETIKEKFMACLRENGFAPVKNKDGVMVYTPNLQDYSKIKKLAKATGFDGCGSYGWGNSNNVRLKAEMESRA